MAALYISVTKHVNFVFHKKAGPKHQEKKVLRAYKATYMYAVPFYHITSLIKRGKQCRFSYKKWSHNYY